MHTEACGELEHVGLTSNVAGRGSFEMRLPPHPPSVAEARARVRALLLECDRQDLVETAVLLTSEVVTNALLHAGTDIVVVARVDVTGLRVEISDGRYAATAGTGRGLLMLESMVDDWGVNRHRAGKTVWFRISGPENNLDDPVEPTNDPARRARRRDNVAVELRNMPLLLHAAW